MNMQITPANIMQQNEAARNLLSRVNNMSTKKRAKYYAHFVELSSIAAQSLPAGEYLSIFDDIAAILYSENSESNDLHQPGAAAQ